MKQVLITFLLTIATVAQIAAQIGGGNCPPGNPFGAPVCEAACTACDMDNGIEGTTPTPIPPPPLGDPVTIPNCFFGAPPITLENPQWYSFIAGSDIIEFGIKTLQCTGTDGLEAAIVVGCSQPYVALNCGPVDPALPIIVGVGLTIGAQYYLVIDGANGDECKFTISVNSGTTKSPELGAIGAISGPTQLCPKGTATYTVPPVPFAVTYTWTAPAGSKINGGGSTLTLPAANFSSTSVNIQFGTVGGNVCFTANNPCDTPKTTCLLINNQALPITQLDDQVICYEQLPYVWEESPNTALLAPGTYTLTSSAYQSYQGCDSIVRQKIKVLPFKYKTLPTIYLCEPNCYNINGVDYCQSGTFLETLVTPDGCDSTINFTIVRIPVQAVVQPADTLTCSKSEVVLTSVGSSMGNSIFYNWLNPSGQSISSSSTAIATTPGTYTFIVTNFGGGGNACKDTATVVVYAETTVPQANAGPDKVLSCSLPTVQLQGTGSSGPQFTYLWIATNGGNIVSGAATLTPTVNAPGTYTLRVTNNENGCTAVGVAVVTAQTLPPSANAVGGTYSCTQPTVTLQATTNAASPTFTWNGPNGYSSTQQNPVVSAGGTYTVVVKDSITGCTNTASAVVVDNTQTPGATASGDTLTCVVSNVVLSGGTPASNPTFAWTGPNGFTSASQNPSVTTAGNYILTVTGTNGCTSTATAVVALSNTPPGATVAATGNLNCNNASINLVAGSSAPSGILSHTWTNPNSTTVTTGTNPVLNVNLPGAYSVLITNTENGCTSTANVTVIQNPNVTAVATSTLASCNGGNDGSVSVTSGGGNGTYTYSWNTTATTATVGNLGVGTYTVTVTDGENCTATATATVSQPEPISVNASATPQTSNGSMDGTASAAPVGGTPGYTYNWSNMGSTATITGLAPGSYTVTVTDINNCTAVAVVNVNAFNCTAAATAQSTNISCAGANDGTATMVVSSGIAPYTYLWSNMETTATIQNLAPGSYSGTATDAGNCPVEVLVLITEPALLQANATSTDASGPGSNDGTATAGPTGGTTPYTYLWTTGDMTASITGLGAGIFTVTVTDDNGCTAVQSVEVLAGNCGLLSDFIAENPSCNGLANGVATVVLTGGNGPFTYLWSSGGDEATEGNLLAGTYAVSVTDVNGCEVTDSVTLEDPALLTIESDTIINTSCVNSPEGSATVLTAGGSGAVNVTWSDGQTGPTAINLPAGDIVATATDANGCTATVTVSIDAVDQVPPVIVANPVEVALGPTGNITVTPQNLGLQVSDNCNVSSITLVPTTFNCGQLGPQAIQVTATDDSGNTSTATVTASIIDNLPPITECPASIVRCFGDNVVQYNAPVATDNCLGNGGMWELTAGLPSGAAFPTGVTTNTYTYTDAGGNPGSCSFEVTVLSQLSATSVITNDIGGQGIGAIDLTVSGGLSPYTFQWTKDGAPFATTEDLTGLFAGNYSVVVLDAFGCTVQSANFTVENLTGTGEPGWANGLFIQPNPTSGYVSVIFPDGISDEVLLTVFDVTGRRVIEETAKAPKEMALDLSALPSGVYPILLRIDNETIARRIVVSK